LLTPISQEAITVNDLKKKTKDLSDMGHIAPISASRKKISCYRFSKTRKLIKACVTRPLIVGTDHTPDYLYMPPGRHVLLF